MAVITNGDLAECIADYMRTFDPVETLGIAKAELRAALDAIDQWVGFP